jgi:acyl-CoA thioester hydrolase
MIDLSAVRALPHALQATVEPRFIDLNGHMNVSFYVHLFDRAVWSFFEAFGLDLDYARRGNAAMFAVEEHVRYLGELHEGDALTIHTGVRELRPKTVRMQQYMVDPRRQRIAAAREVVGMHIDRGSRRSAPFPEDRLARLREAASERPAGEPLDEPAAQAHARAWIEAWNRPDIEAVLAMFADDAVFTSPKAEALVGRGRLQGKAPLRAYWQEALARINEQHGRLHFTLEQALWSPGAQALTILYRTVAGAEPAQRAAEVLQFQGDRVVEGQALYGALAEPAKP